MNQCVSMFCLLQTSKKYYWYNYENGPPEVVWLSSGINNIVHMYEVFCYGSEKDLSECDSVASHDCRHREDSSIICRG